MSEAAKPASQDRSRRTRDALIGALEELLREKPFDAIAVAEIAARAGVSPASIYQRFRNKDAATAILMELNVQRVAEWGQGEASAVQAIREATTVREAMLRLGALSWRQCAALRHIMRPAYLYSMLRPEQFGAEWAARLETERNAGFRTVLEAHRGEIARRDVGAAAGTVARVCNMMVAGLLLHGDAGAGEDGAEAFARELADLVCAYLTTPDAEAGA